MRKVIQRSVYCSTLETPYTIIMEILRKHEMKIALHIAPLLVAKKIRDEGLLNEASYCSLLNSHCPNELTHDLLDIIDAQQNIPALAQLFKILIEDYQSIVVQIPELWSGTRYILELSQHAHCKVIVHEGEAFVLFSKKMVRQIVIISVNIISDQHSKFYTRVIYLDCVLFVVLARPTCKRRGVLHPDTPKI